MDYKDLERIGITEKEVGSSNFKRLLNAGTRQNFVDIVNGDSEIRRSLGCSKLYLDDFKGNKYKGVYDRLK